MALDANSRAPADAAGEEFTYSRTFAAPSDLVWKAHTEAERLKHWWGPKGFTMLTCTVDLRPGGLFHYGMRSPDGNEMWGKWVYREIVVPELLSCVVSFSDKAGGITRHPWSAEWPLEVFSTLVLTDVKGKTRLDMKGNAINATAAERATFAAGFGSMEQGFNGTLDQLDAYLATL
jgi:uncharacterized protein YndB with AHSA1/START domain